MATAERTTLKERSDNFVYQRHLIAYQRAEQNIGGNVLEVGCGDGYGLKILAPCCDSYTGIDKFPTHIDEAFAKTHNITFRQMEVPPFTGMEDNTFDHVVSFQVIEHIEDDDQFVKEIHRVLKPGGTMMITTPNILMSLTRNPWHVREYLTKELEDLCAKYFSSVNMEGLYGNDRITQYYEKNKASVQRITRFDILDLQHRLPRQLLQVPYDFLNRMNRKKLMDENTSLVNQIVTEDFSYAPAEDHCYDYFVTARK